MVTSKEDVLQEYIKFRKLKNHGRTIKDIEHYIRSFLFSTKKTLEDMDEKDLLDHLSKITDKYAIHTLNTIKSSYIKNFVKWYWIDWSLRFRNLDHICKTEKPGETYKPEDMLSEEDFKKLVDAEELIFWKAYFMTLFYGCCRPVEVCNLEWKDVEFEDDGAYISIYSSKNRRSFLKYVPHDVAELLKKLDGGDKTFVFFNKKAKQPISVKGAYHHIRVLSEKALGKKIGLYILRHSIATINYNKDDIKDDDIARQMGHSKSMKEKYVHNDRGKLKQIAKRIYIPTEPTEEQKNEMQKQIDGLKTIIATMMERVAVPFDKATELQANGQLLKFKEAIELADLPKIKIDPKDDIKVIIKE